MSVQKNELIKRIREIAPETLAEEWDNTGLQIDTGKALVDKVFLCLEINEAVINEAIKNNADIIIAHHPFIFNAIKNIRDDNWMGRMLIKLIKHDIAIYAAHTSFDSANEGNNDYLAHLLGIKHLKPLEANKENYYKLVVFIPHEASDQVRNAICKAGAGAVNDYSDCTFSHEGVGTYMPLSTANPYIGERNKLERVNEIRLESIVSEDKLKKVISSMIEQHPYEEPAYDVIKLENKINTSGMGRAGFLDEAKTLKDVCKIIKERLQIDEPIMFTGDENQKIKKIALCTGSGAGLIKKAYDHNCQLYITGDIKYHDAQLAQQLGIALIDAKHFHTEKIFAENISNQLRSIFQDKIKIIQSSVDLNPFKFL